MAPEHTSVELGRSDGANAAGAAISPSVQSISQKYWFGIEKPIQRVYMGLMLCAAVGLITVTGWYCSLPELPSRGLLQHAWVMPALYATIMLCSAGWSFAVTQPVPSRLLVAATLVGTAVSSILLLAGVMESNVRTWYAVLGALAFGTVTVLSDSVGWLANFLVE